MAAAKATGKGSEGASELPRLRQKYVEVIVPKLQTEFGYKNVHQIPKIEKVVINIGLGEATTNPKLVERAVDELSRISGQKPVIRRSKKSIANFKLREGQSDRRHA